MPLNSDLTREQSNELYEEVLSAGDPDALRRLCREDLFFLLERGVKRFDFDDDWLYARVREVESAPDGFLDLWFREARKDIATTVPVLTSNRGWTTHGDLEIGDLVFSPSGKPTKIIALSPKYTDSTCYKITFEDGESLICGQDHLWRLKRRIKSRINGTNRRSRTFVDEVFSTKEILSKHGRRDVGVCEPIFYKSRELPIDPYTFGAWLGDGTSECGAITTAYSDIEIIEKMVANGVEVHECKSTNNNTGLFRLNGGVRGQRGTGMTCVLRKMGVKNNKHIPTNYLHGSISQRMELLRGLMDTDGHCSAKGTAYFSNTNERLAKNVFELAVGLGMMPKFRKRIIQVHGDYPVWSVCFAAHTDRNPFALKRKADRAIKPSHYRGARMVKSIELVGTVPTSCIQVEGDLYCVGTTLVPTHNSTIITFGKTIQDILVDQEETFGLFSHTSPIAKAFLSQIKRELETNNFLKDLFPDILYRDPQRESPVWSLDKGIIVKRKSNPKESTVEAHGLVDAQPTSAHYGVLVYDDVVTKDSVTSPDMIQKTTSGWEMSLNLGAERIMPDGTKKACRKRYSGTRYHHDDTYKIIIDRGAAKPRMYFPTDLGQKDIDVVGKPVFFSLEYLREKRKSMAIYSYGSQMLQNPTADTVAGFNIDWLEYYNFLKKFETWNKYLLVDPANEKKKTSDYTVMVVLGLAEDNNMYLLDGIRDKLNLTERAKKLFELHRQWQPRMVGYEKYGMQADIEHIQYVQEQEGYRFGITPLGGAMPKNDRIRRMVPVFEQHRFFMPRQLLFTTHELKAADFVAQLVNDEYMTFPMGSHDDGLDCISRITDDELSAVFPKITLPKTSIYVPEEKYDPMAVPK